MSICVSHHWKNDPLRQKTAQSERSEASRVYTWVALLLCTTLEEKLAAIENDTDNEGDLPGAHVTSQYSLASRKVFPVAEQGYLRGSGAN